VPQEIQEKLGMEMNLPSLTEVVKSGNAEFSFYRIGKLYYTVTVNGFQYIFPVPEKEVRDASVFRTMKAIHLMRWIKKAMESELFVFNGLGD
jgi:hypothetical protein